MSNFEKYLYLPSICLLFICLLSSQAVSGQAEFDLPFVRSSPEASGFHQDSVEILLETIKNTEPFDFRGLVVLKDDSIAIEEYYNTYWRETIHDIRSAGKSITSMLLGIAIDKGFVKSIDENIYDFFPEFHGVKRHDITIKDLLIMSSGLDADTFDENSPGNSGNWIGSSNWVETVLNLSKVFEPGERWVYTDACAMLVGAIIEKTSGMKLSEFAELHLFAPLGIKEYYWYTGRSGRTGAMGNLYLSTFDFAKLGYLVLKRGKWFGESIVSESYLNEMVKPHMDINGIVPFSKSYGYFWYSSEYVSDSSTYTYHFAAGNGGNLLFVVPDLNLVAAFTASAYGLGRGQFRSNKIFELLLGYLKE